MAPDDHSINQRSMPAAKAKLKGTVYHAETLTGTETLPLSSANFAFGEPAASEYTAAPQVPVPAVFLT